MKMGGVSPSTVNVVPSLSRVSPSTVNVVPSLNRVSPSTVNVVPSLYRVSPSTVNVVPSLYRVSPLLHAARSSSRLRILCSPGAPGPGENDSRAVLDAFLLGKAVAEALTERIESTVGEFLSTVGRLQAEQQKQVQEFQEEVFERAKKAKEKAAREAMEEQGLVPTSATQNPSTTVSSESYTVTSGSDASSVANVNGAVTVQGDEAGNEDPLSGVSTDK